MSFLVFAAMATVFFYPRIFTGSVGRRILLVVPVDTLYRTSIISFSTALPLNPFLNLSLAPFSLFLTYGPDLGVWPDNIPRKGWGSTTTTHHINSLCKRIKITKTALIGFSLHLKCKNKICCPVKIRKLSYFIAQFL